MLVVVAAAVNAVGVVVDASTDVVYTVDDDNASVVVAAAVNAVVCVVNAFTVVVYTEKNKN